MVDCYLIPSSEIGTGISYTATINYFKPVITRSNIVVLVSLTVLLVRQIGRKPAAVLKYTA